jgi:hypothetical protein
MLTLTDSDIATLCNALHAAANATSFAAMGVAAETRRAYPELVRTARSLDESAAKYRALHDRIASASAIRYTDGE